MKKKNGATPNTADKTKLLSHKRKQPDITLDTKQHIIRNEKIQLSAKKNSSESIQEEVVRKNSTSENVIYLNTERNFFFIN